MPACLHPETTRDDNPFSVHSQAADRGSAYRRQADNLRAILTPPEMLLPDLSTRVEQRNFLLVIGVDACLEILLETVTASAGQAQVIYLGLAASDLGHDVIYFHRYDDDLRGLAIFAQPARPFRDLLAQGIGQVCH
jgi:hypothetical protein